MPTLKLMADMLKNPVFDAEELEKMKTERLAGIESYKNEPQFIASNRVSQINNNYPKGHPNYAMTIDEEVEAIKAVSVDDIKKFYEDFYGLGKSILIGIGNVNSAEVKTFIEKEFGDFNSKNAYEMISNPYSANKAVNEDVITPDKQNAMTFGTLSVKMSQYSDDYAAMNIAGSILGGGFLNSRIADRLRQKDGVSYGAGAGFNADGNKVDQNSGLYLYAIYAPANYDKVQLGFKEEIDRYIKDGITEEELKNAVNGWIQAQSVSRAKDNELSSLINNNIFYGRDMNFQKSLEEKVAKLTVAEVNAAIKKHILPYEKWTVVNAGDFKKE
jgi:zinc protease